MKRFGLGFLGAPNVNEIMNSAQTAEKYGFDSLWMSETRFVRDAVSPLAAMATITTKIRLGSAALNVHTRGPVLMATTLATLDELSRGRIVLGIGPGSPTILEKQGIDFAGSLTRLKEYVEVFRELIKGKTVTYRGKFVSVNNVGLDFNPPRNEIPVYFAVSGPKALKLAGKIANGVILDVFTTPEYAKSAIQQIREGAESAGRKLSDVDIAIFSVISVNEDSAMAKKSLKPHIAMYFTIFPSIAKESGVPADLLESISSTYRNKGPAQAADLISDSIVDRLTVSGDEDECITRIREYREAGVKVPIIIPLSSQTESAMKVALEA